MRVPGNIIDVGGGHSGHSSRNRGRKDRNTVKFCCSLIFGYIRHLRKDEIKKCRCRLWL